MFDFLFSEGNVLFIAALVAMLAIGLLEGLASIVGVGFSNLIDSLIPNVDVGIEVPDFGDVPDAGVLDGPLDTSSPLMKTLGWLRLGRIPFIVFLVVTLSIFGISGLSLQLFFHRLFGGYLPLLIAGPAALFVTLPLTRMSAMALERILPKDESSAITEASFIGRSATVVTGTARHGAPAQAKVRDEHGQSHYVMVEPDADQTEFEVGSKVLLVKKQGAVFVCIVDVTESILAKG